MSDPKRYHLSAQISVTANHKAEAVRVIIPDETGFFVTYDDYARLKAEVERLRKAGDAMLRAIKVSDPILDWKIELWNAAKDGKPSE